MAKYKVINNKPTTADFWWRQPLINADGSFKKDSDGNIQVEQMVVRTVDSEKLDEVSKFIASGGSLSKEEIDKINAKLAELEKKVEEGSSGSSGSGNYAICSYTGSNSYVLSPAKYNIFLITLSSADTSISINANDLSSGNLVEIRLYLKQGTGSNTVTWGNNIKWLNGLTPTLSFTVGKYDIVQMSSIDGGKTWFGSFVSSWN